MLRMDMNEMLIEWNHETIQSLECIGWVKKQGVCLLEDGRITSQVI